MCKKTSQVCVMIAVKYDGVTNEVLDAVFSFMDTYCYNYKNYLPELYGDEQRARTEMIGSC